MRYLIKYKFEIFCLLAVVVLFVATQVIENRFYFFTGFIILQFIAMATAWNILGGYAGYVNFGSAGFLAVGAYSSVVLIKFFNADLITQLVVGGLLAAALGFLTGYLTLRLRGIFFAIATLALAIVLETLMVNWEYVGGAAGISILPTRKPTILGFLIVDRKAGLFGNYKELLFLVMGIVAVLSVFAARTIEHSKLGRGLRAIKDNEEAAECMGVPTLRLKLTATTISGFLMGVAGAPFVSFLTFIDPFSAFDLQFSVNAIAMAMIGGTVTWVGPVVGAILLGSVQQAANVTISSEMNLLIVGVLLVVFVVIAPTGIVGWFRKSG